MARVTKADLEAYISRMQEKLDSQKSEIERLNAELKMYRTSSPHGHLSCAFMTVQKLSDLAGEIVRKAR